MQFLPFSQSVSTLELSQTAKKPQKIELEQNETLILIEEASCLSLDLYNILLKRCKLRHDLQNSSRSLVSTCCSALCLDAFNSRTSWIIIIIIITILIVITVIIVIVNVF